MFEWLFGYPVLLVLLGVVGTVGLFAAWLAAPLTWRDGESGRDENGHFVSDRYKLFYIVCEWWEKR